MTLCMCAVTIMHGLGSQWELKAPMMTMLMAMHRSINCMGSSYIHRATSAFACTEP